MLRISTMRRPLVGNFPRRLQSAITLVLLHLLVLQWAAEVPRAKAELTTEEKQSALDLHNLLRSQAAQGCASNVRQLVSQLDFDTDRKGLHGGIPIVVLPYTNNIELQPLFPALSTALHVSTKCLSFELVSIILL